MGAFLFWIILIRMVLGVFGAWSHDSDDFKIDPH